MRRDEQGSFSYPVLEPIGVTMLWNAEQAEQVLLFLDELRAQIWARHGEQINRQHHEDAVQQSLDLDGPPF